MAEQESLYLWSTTALTNASADPAINWAEGQLPSTVNNSNRGMMAAIARFVKDTDGSLTTAGSANAYTLTINGRQTPLATGHRLSVKANFANTGAATLAVTNADAVALGTKAIRAPGDAALSAGQIISGGRYDLEYDTAANSAAGAWMLLNPHFTGPGIAPPEVLSADRTYFVRADGNDSNTGLANTSGGAFLTIQAAVNAAYRVNSNLKNITIQVGAGTYTNTVNVSGPLPGAGKLFIVGDTGTPSNCVMNAADPFFVTNGAVVDFSGFKIISSNNGISVNYNGVCTAGFINFGVCTGYHRFVDLGGTLVMTGNYSITGNAAGSIHLTDHSRYEEGAVVCTIVSTVTLINFYFGASENSAANFANSFAGGTIAVPAGNRAFIHNGAFGKDAGATANPDLFFSNTFFSSGFASLVFGTGAWNDNLGTVAAVTSFSAPVLTATTSAALATITQTATPTASPTVNSSGSTVSVANSGSSGELPLLRGMVIISDATVGDCGVYAVSNGATTLIATPNGVYVAPTTSPGVGKASLCWDGAGGYRIYNHLGSTTTFSVMQFMTS